MGKGGGRRPRGTVRHQVIHGSPCRTTDDIISAQVPVLGFPPPAPALHDLGPLERLDWWVPRQLIGPNQRPSPGVEPGATGTSPVVSGRTITRLSGGATCLGNRRGWEISQDKQEQLETEGRHPEDVRSRHDNRNSCQIQTFLSNKKTLYSHAILCPPLLP